MQQPIRGKTTMKKMAIKELDCLKLTEDETREWEEICRTMSDVQLPCDNNGDTKQYNLMQAWPISYDKEDYGKTPYWVQPWAAFYPSNVEPYTMICSDCCKSLFPDKKKNFGIPELSAKYIQLGD